MKFVVNELCRTLQHFCWTSPKAFDQNDRQCIHRAVVLALLEVCAALDHRALKFLLSKYAAFYHALFAFGLDAR